jgi:hypothetical protein
LVLAGLEVGAVDELLNDTERLGRPLAGLRLGYHAGAPGVVVGRSIANGGYQQA